MAAAEEVVQQTANRIGDRTPPMLNHYDTWNFFRFLMGWDCAANPARFNEYLNDLCKAFPDEVISIDHGNIEFCYSPHYTNETIEDTKARNDKKIGDYFHSTDMKPEHLNLEFKEQICEELENAFGFISGFPFQHILNPISDICVTSGITKGYFVGVHKRSLIDNIKHFIEEKHPEAVVFICKGKTCPNMWFLVLTWPEYVPEGWKREYHEYKRVLSVRKITEAKTEKTPEEFCKELFEKHKDIFMRLAKV